MSESTAQTVEPQLVMDDGCILAYRILDVGDEIDLEAAERILADAPGRRRARLTREGAQGLQFAVPPLDVALGKRMLTLGSGRTIEAELTARLFDYAAVSVVFEWPIPSATSFEALLPVCDEIYESSVLEEIARSEVATLVTRLAPAIQGKHEWNEVETYTVIFAKSLEGSPPKDRIVRAPVVAKLLLGEPGPKSLSQEEREDVLQHAHSYFDDDLAIIDWNSAFVLEPSGSRDIPDILEFATSQLLELRYYDRLIDRELGRIYDEFGSARHDYFALFRSRYEKLARAVQRRLVELTEFTERVDNALKVVGDFYLARVYQSAVRRFRIPSWQASVDGKQALVAQTYNLLKGEVDIRRSTLLEIVVIVLILLELVAAVRGR
jgi:hypothetical protein